jgi:hypothetical protein
VTREDYLVDPKEAMKKSTAIMLNEATQLKPKSKSRPDSTNAPAREKHIAMEQDHDHSRSFPVK